MMFSKFNLSLITASIFMSVCSFKTNNLALTQTKPDPFSGKQQIENPAKPAEKRLTPKYGPDDKYDAVSVNDMYLVHGKKLNLLQITPKSVQAAFGKPVSAKLEYWEVEDAKVLTYKYQGGSLYFLKNELLGFDITGKGLYIAFENKNKPELLLTSGSAEQKLAERFPASHQNLKDHMVHVFVKTVDGNTSDVFFAFDLTASHTIAHIYYGMQS